MLWLLAGAAIGAAASMWGKYQQGQQEKAALAQQKDSAWLQYLYGKQYGDAQFSLQKSEALDQLAVQQRNLDTNLGLSVNEYNTNLLAQAFGIQDARIQTGSAIGASLASEGASGTRGNFSNEMIRAYAAQGLERNIEVQDRQNSDYLNRMITGANMTVDAIGRERGSWMPGGYRTQMKEAQDNYNLNLANLGQSNFNWQIDNANPTFTDYFTSAMSGASSGMSLGNSISNWADNFNWKNPWSALGKG